ncbi:small GTPase, putative [Ixodes scapularis]|uniref:Small GTPase, putative n=1 Tax=Ixodes scapularis TaxID=6945 RepID=B7QBI6_IXOSC|nr:small GTPase, putative [Ixodes scapularis]|eukprot:XP_002412912.1 small GTPase, putative [Ixodes scapularis]
MTTPVLLECGKNEHYRTVLGEEVCRSNIADDRGIIPDSKSAPLYYRKANAAIIVYDITSPNSFEAMKHWVTELRRNVEEAIGIFIVGNKCDLSSHRTVSQEAARKFAESIGGNFFECSALSNEGIDDIFRELALSIAEAEDKANTTGQLMKCYSLPQEAMLSGSTSDSFALLKTIRIDKLPPESSEPKASRCSC